MKFISLFAIALSLASFTPSLAFQESDSSHVAARDWVDDPFIGSRDYYEVHERDIDFEDDLFEREDLLLWDRSPELEEEAIYERAGPSEAFKKLNGLAGGHMAVGKSYAFELTFPLGANAKKPPPKETADQKRLRELQLKLGYSHKALLVGTVTADKDFKGLLYEMTTTKFSMHTESRSAEWRLSSVPTAYKGEVKNVWTEPKIVAAGKDLNHKAERGGKYGFEQWHCGIFSLELFSTLTRDPK